ncbi:MAG TPA: hypothetical protein VHU80_05630 [Polyangiaceae bacterium]|nr:hypothetical protein [Polyangiaceae bacterium]
MSNGLTAHDLWPLVLRLPHDEQVKLARLALQLGAPDDATAYKASPPLTGEFDADEDPLGWEGEGWEEFSASR